MCRDTLTGDNGESSHDDSPCYHGSTSRAGLGRLTHLEFPVGVWPDRPQWGLKVSRCPLSPLSSFPTFLSLWSVACESFPGGDFIAYRLVRHVRVCSGCWCALSGGWAATPGVWGWECVVDGLVSALSPAFAQECLEHVVCSCSQPIRDVARTPGHGRPLWGIPQPQT